jgi:lactoylglutathione lyase/glyoxylase I family protein
MTISLAHVCILTPDLEATRRFYCDALGMETAFEFHKDGELYGYYLKMSERNYIEVFKDSVMENIPSRIRHLCLETDDIEAARRKMVEAGVEVTEIKKGCDDTFQFWFKDPNGIDIELHQYTATSSQLTGRDCIVDW